MKYLDVYIDAAGKAELKNLLDINSVAWHEGKVLRFSAGSPDLLNFIIQSGVVGGLTTVIVQWLKAKRNRKVKITKMIDGLPVETDITGYSVSEVERILSLSRASNIHFEEDRPTETVDP
ncbi:effector-associated constant component EACC1 [Shewanella subflava]|uniref:Uncharacterized protein n=1 Tax=Shewanella subflava TaxID=2986476 RepID=A0ABT3I5G4_9GAMM|nr:hypothetical protein [Shewanella subflava]MCW3171253.1 hypothetical protein [Shewanella subflava]